MQLAHHYLRVRNHFHGMADGVRIETSLQELAEVFCCTGRNVKIIVKQLADAKWIEWLPGRGRGHYSHLVFLAQTEEVAFQLAQQHVKRGYWNDALAVLNEFSTLPIQRERFLAWLSQQFGFRVEETEKRSLDTLRMPFYRPIPAIDPAFVTRRTEAHMVKQVFDTLIRYDAREKRFLPHVAHYWETNADRTEWTFYLRKGVLFHHGRELNAHDVKLTFERMRQPATGSPYRWMFAHVEEISVPRQSVLKIRLQRPNSLFLHFLSSERASIIPHEVVQERGERFAREPVGTGPFRLVRNDDTVFLLEAFPHYFQGRAHLDRIEIWIVPDIRVHGIINQLDAEHLHFHPFRKLTESTSLWKELDKVETGYKYIAFNLNRPGPQQQSNFRKALDLLLDRERMIAELGANRLFPASGFFPGKAHLAVRARPEEARRLLRESGYRGEVLTFYTYEGSSNETDAEWVQRQCREAGIELELHVLPIEQVKHQAAEADLLLSGEVFDEDLEFGLTETFQQETSFYRAHWSPQLREAVDRQIARVLQEESCEQRMRLLEGIEELLKKECAVLFLYHSRQSTAYHSALEGVSLNALGWVDYKEIWFK
ncbi:SgrR family transcriptional regulator [Brevibacillus sp. H7]|uniref:SgrR family transcriptional regulator n=1 Tax=Brevibacillus sp. H7 TaxID=3349138 RepID=UPI0037F23945